MSEAGKSGYDQGVTDCSEDSVVRRDDGDPKEKSRVCKGEGTSTGDPRSNETSGLMSGLQTGLQQQHANEGLSTRHIPSACSTHVSELQQCSSDVPVQLSAAAISEKSRLEPNPVSTLCPAPSSVSTSGIELSSVLDSSHKLRTVPTIGDGPSISVKTGLDVKKGEGHGVGNGHDVSRGHVTDATCENGGVSSSLWPNPSCSVADRNTHHGSSSWSVDSRGAASEIGLPWRDGSQVLGQKPSAVAPDRDRRRPGTQGQQGKEPSSHDGDSTEQGSSQEERTATAGARDGNQCDRQRDHPGLVAPWSRPSSEDHTRTPTGFRGLREALREVVPGGHDGGSRLLPVGDDNRPRGSDVCSPAAIGQVAHREQRCGHVDDAHRQEKDQQGEDQWIWKDGERGCGSQHQLIEQPRNPSDVEQPDGDSEDPGIRCGRGQEGQQGVPEEDQCLRGRQHFEQRMGGRKLCMNLPNVVDHMTCDWTDEPESEPKKLSLHESKALDWKGERILPDCLEELVQLRRPVLFEIACSPDSVLSEKMRAATKSEHSAKRLAFWNGYDVSTNLRVRAVLSAIDKERPLSVWLSLECGPFSKMQQINQRNEKQIADLKQKRELCIRMYVGGLIIFSYCAQRGIPVTWEWSETCDAWRLPMVQRVFSQFEPWMVVTKGCRVKLMDPKSKQLLGKGWKLATTHEGVARAMDLPCLCSGKHVPCQGKLTRMSAYYTDDFAKRVCRALLHSTEAKSLFRELRGENTQKNFRDGFPQECTCHLVQHPKSKLTCHLCELGNETGEPLSLVGEEVSAEDLEPLSEEEKQRCLQKIGQLHRNTGHGPVEHLVKALTARNTDPRVIALAKTFRRSVCHELKRQVPRPRSTVEPLPPKWKVAQADNAHWIHPHTMERVQFTIMIDEGCRFRLGKVMCKGKGGIKGNQLISFYQENWKPVFGKPVKLRLDPAGTWKSNEIEAYFDNEQVELDHIPAEAHWGISHVERAIQCTKQIMTKLAQSEPDITPEEALAEAIRTENEREVVRGFTPAQHALGRAPDDLGRFLDPQLQGVPDVLCENPQGEFQRNNERMKVAEQAMSEHVYNERLKRAQNTRSDRVQQFLPGDLVFVWRIQTRGPAASARTGGYTGPCRVLATETRITEDEQLRPGSIVWLVRGSRLIKANSRQLRHASTREEYVEHLANPIQLPWTMTKLISGIDSMMM